MRGPAAFVFDDAGRLLEMACVRETFEETGAEVRIENLVGSYGLPDITVHAFRCTIVSGVPALQPTDELSAVEWRAPDAIPEPKSNVLHHALGDALSGRRDVARRGLPRIT